MPVTGVALHLWPRLQWERTRASRRAGRGRGRRRAQAGPGAGRRRSAVTSSPPPPRGPRRSVGGRGGAHSPSGAAGAESRGRRPPSEAPPGLPARPGRTPAALQPARSPRFPAAGRAMALALAALAAVEPACGSRYQQLQNEEEPGEPEQTASDAPPPYSSISAEGAAYFDYKDESGFPKPPSYNVATTLPTYDEAERTKAEATIPLVPGRDEDFVGRDDFDDADQLRIGNDGIFMLTFFMAFLFNWIGFFLSFCLTTSAAGRYGAISGFGLSLIKWILIVRFSTYFPGYFDGQYWLWWVFLVLGFLLFLRGFINYAKVRKMPETFSNLPRTRVLFIY